MTDAAAPVAAPAPEAASPTQAASPLPVAPSDGKQPQAQETPKVDPAAKDIERRAAALARTKREAARVHADREALKNERAAQSAALQKAADYDRLDALRKTDTVAYLEAVGIDFSDASRKFLEKRTGANKSPQELVDEAVNKRLSEEAAKREESSAKQAQEQQERLAKQTLEGAQRQLSTIVKGDPERFELVGATGDASIKRAWSLVEDFYAENQQVLDFSKALDAIEARLESEQLGIISNSKKVRAALEKQRAAAAEAAKKPQPNVKGVRSQVESRELVETQNPSPVSPQLRRRYRDPRVMAAQLVAEHKAKHDN